MPQKAYLYILQGGVYLSLLAVFLVFKNLLFPFITSKQIFFNVVVEVLAIFWIALLAKYPEYRPKKNFVTFGLLAFFGAILLSCFTSVDFNLSFWGDVERMLGVFHVLHFFVFYLIIITAFRSKADWTILLSLSSLFAIFVAIDSLKPTRYATIGNTAYVSGYMIFNLYFNLLLFFSFRGQGWRWLFLLGLPFYFASLNTTDTSGAIVGLGISLFVILFLYAVLHQNKKIKIATIAISVLFAIFVSNFFIFNRDNFLTQRSYNFKKLTGDISFAKNTFQTRLISWKAAFQDFHNHPLLGTGHGNYAVTFDKYFDPKFYDFTRGETYFDRAHNNVIDILSTTGLLGLLAYLSIFVALAFYLIQGYRQGKISQNQFIMVSGLITAYFVQNLAVFDSLVTYMGLMITLAYVYWLYHHSEEAALPHDRVWENKEVYALVLSGLVLLTITYQYNIKVFKMLDATIAGQRAYAEGNIEKTIAEYERALAFETPLDRDSRTSLNRLFVSNPNILSGLSRERGQEILDYNIDLAKKNVDYNKEDSLNQMVLAQLYNVAANYNKDDKEKFAFYSDQALEAINASIAATPGRIPVYYQKSQIYLTRGDKDSAINTLKEAAALSDTYYDSFCHLGRTLLYYQDQSGWDYVDQCLDKGGAIILEDQNLIKLYINHYAEKGDWERTEKLYVRLSEISPKDVETLIKLAKLYDKLNKISEAIAAVEKAIEIDSSISAQAEQFIAELKKRQ